MFNMLSMSPCARVARAVACCGGVASLYKKYGGPFVAIAAGESARPGERVKAPKRGSVIKRTIRGWKS